MDSEEWRSDIALVVKARAAWIKTQPLDLQEKNDVDTPYQPGVLFTLLVSSCEPRTRTFSHAALGGVTRCQQVWGRKNFPPEEEDIQASFTYPRMHFPTIPQPPATLQTAGPKTSSNVVTLESTSPPRVPSWSHAPFQQWEWDASCKKPPVSVGCSVSPSLWAAAERSYTSISLQRREGKALASCQLAHLKEGKQSRRPCDENQWTTLVSAS